MRHQIRYYGYLKNEKETSVVVELNGVHTFNEDQTPQLIEWSI